MGTGDVSETIFGKPQREQEAIEQRRVTALIDTARLSTSSFVYKPHLQPLSKFVIHCRALTILIQVSQQIRRSVSISVIEMRGGGASGVRLVKTASSCSAMRKGKVCVFRMHEKGPRRCNFGWHDVVSNSLVPATMSRSLRSLPPIKSARAYRDFSSTIHRFQASLFFVLFCLR